VNVKEEGKTIEIKIHDKKGLCSIEIAGEKSDREDVYQRILIATVWEEFRSGIDSCSNDVCDCSAMDIPVWSSEKDVKQKIAEEFIRTLEWLTDTPISIKWDEKKAGWARREWKKRLLAAKKYDNITKTNRIYLERFLEIYSKDLNDADDLRDTMDARSEKAAMIYEDAIFKAELGFRTLTTNYTLFAISVAVAGLLLRFFTDIL